MWDKAFGAGHPTLTSWELGKRYGGKKVREHYRIYFPNIAHVGLTRSLFYGLNVLDRLVPHLFDLHYVQYAVFVGWGLYSTTLALMFAS